MKTESENEGHDEKANEQARALRRYMFFFLVPFWFVPGVADWYCHRRSKIEATSGTHESLTHVLMMGVVGVPITLALLFEVNALVIAAAIWAYVVHEGINIWDVAYADGRREVSSFEQHTHSYLEVLPMTAAAAVACMRPKQFAALFGRGNERARWSLERKTPALPAAYVAAVLGSVGAFIVLPYAEEFLRCFRYDHTILPHRTTAAQERQAVADPNFST